MHSAKIWYKKATNELHRTPSWSKQWFMNKSNMSTSTAISDTPLLWLYGTIYMCISSLFAVICAAHIENIIFSLFAINLDYYPLSRFLCIYIIVMIICIVYIQNYISLVDFNQFIMLKGNQCEHRHQGVSRKSALIAWSRMGTGNSLINTTRFNIVLGISMDSTNAIRISDNCFPCKHILLSLKIQMVTYTKIT